MRERKRDKSLSHSDCAVEYLSESGAAVLHTHTQTHSLIRGKHDRMLRSPHGYKL